ncbi:unnamed protein product [Prorocentrum cordatum]|uniref:Uncharacterized protein n=1 Tax=Prorocentrum cordatum TaxID=2364126 RepID=A0ABN9P9W4_9DINO|nr:unnamed protein product [Polarella glacialis]
MALSARHAPPSKLGKRHVRAAPGGLQDAYIGAVRWCLTSATLKSRTHARAPDAASAGSASTAYEERPRGAGAALPGCQGDIQGPLVVAVREAHESAEGLLLVARVVAEAEVLLQALGHRAHGIVGGAESSARLLLHRQHPALQGQHHHEERPVCFMAAAEVAPRPWHTAAGAWLCDRCCGPPWPRSPAAAVRGPRGVQHRVIGREGLHKLCGPATVATSAQWSWCCAATRSPTPCRISPSMPPSSFLSPALPLPSWLACRPRVRRPTVQAGSCSLPDVRTVVPRRPSIFALGRAVLPARARSAAVARPSLPRACRSG